jgi:hypothetical protein
MSDCNTDWALRISPQPIGVDPHGPTALSVVPHTPLSSVTVGDLCITRPSGRSNTPLLIMQCAQDAASQEWDLRNTHVLGTPGTPSSWPSFIPLGGVGFRIPNWSSNT